MRRPAGQTPIPPASLARLRAPFGFSHALCLVAVWVQLCWPVAMTLHRLAGHTDTTTDAAVIPALCSGQPAHEAASLSHAPLHHDESQCSTCQLLCTVRMGSLAAIANTGVFQTASIPRIAPALLLAYVAPTPSGNTSRGPPAA